MLGISGVYAQNVIGSDFIPSYSWTFAQDLGSGVIGPNFCDVTVDSVLGQVVRYFGSHFPVLISRVPSLSPQQAMQAAMQAVLYAPGQPGEVRGLSVTKPDPMNGQRLLYQLTFSEVGIGNPRQATSYSVFVDANDGTLVEWDVLSSIAPPSSRTAGLCVVFDIAAAKALQKKRAKQVQQVLGFVWEGQTLTLTYPPTRIGGRPYVYAGYLASGQKGAGVRSHGAHRLTIVSGKRAIELQDSGHTYRYVGKETALPAPSVRVDGRWYVPLQVAQSGWNGSLTYDATKKVVRFTKAVKAAREIGHPAHAGRSARP